MDAIGYIHPSKRRRKSFLIHLILCEQQHFSHPEPLFNIRFFNSPLTLKNHSLHHLHASVITHNVCNICIYVYMYVYVDMNSEEWNGNVKNMFFKIYIPYILYSILRLLPTLKINPFHHSASPYIYPFIISVSIIGVSISVSIGVSISLKIFHFFSKSYSSFEISILKGKIISLNDS